VDAHIVEPENPLPPMTLEALPEGMRQAVARAGWPALMPVQAKAIPYLLARRDLMIQSRTGSGKTGAFLLPIFQRIDPARPVCQALILVPTRELARQVTHEAELLSGSTDIRTVPVYGGVGYGAQLDGLRRGAHLVVGTPGRILDHLMRRSLSLDHLDILVFDEADRLLSMGFFPDMKEVQSYLPRRPVNACMFSATFPGPVLRLAREFMHQPGFLSLSRDRVHVEETEHIYYIVPPMNKDRCLVRIIEMENPPSAIIFCNTKARVHYLTVVLQRFGYDADELSADLPQAAREEVMQRVRKGFLRFLVATDLAGRGIDIPELTHVFLYEVPEEHEGYIHRAGRTGRAGATGTAISLVSSMEELELRAIAKKYKIDLEKREMPTDEEFEAIVAERLTALLEQQLRIRDKLEVERMRRFLPLARNLAQAEDELAVIAMLLDDYYQASLHGRLALPSAAPTRAESRPRPFSGEPPSGDPSRRRRPRRRGRDRK
jgi:ATP-dependent RNA helicase DeaD